MFLLCINVFFFFFKFFERERTADPSVFLATNLPSPKCLADLFEAVAGAIYLDSGRCLDPVRKSYLPMLQYAFGKDFHE